MSYHAMVIVFCVESCIFDLESENASVGRNIGHDRSVSDSFRTQVVCYLESGRKTCCKREYEGGGQVLLDGVERRDDGNVKVQNAGEASQPAANGASNSPTSISTFPSKHNL